MKGILAFFALFSGLPGLADDRLVPFDDFYISVDTNWRAAKGGEGEALQVNVRVHRSEENPGGSVDTEVSCSAFDSEEEEFSESDLKTFFEAFAAARNGDEFRKEIVSRNVFGGAVKTRFETDLAGTKPILRVGRGKVEVYFSLEEAENTKEALTLAKAAEEWYKKLLIAKERPEIAPAAHPPPADGMFLSSTVGRVPGGGFAFEIGVRNWGRLANDFEIEYGLGSESPGWWTAGDWVETLTSTIAEALEAGKAGRPFAHESGSGRNRKENAVFVTVDPATGKAEVMIRFGEGLLGDEPVHFGTFGETELAGLRQLEAEAEDRKKWFEEHKSLFFVPPPEDP